MPRGSPEPKLKKKERKELARRLRAVLAQGPRDMAEMAAALQVEPEYVVIGLRELRKKRRGRLRSGMRAGRACWWWEAPDLLEPPNMSDPPVAIG
jgi:hypothetical protein